MSDEEVSQFVAGLNSLLGSNGAEPPAEDQGSTMRLPDNGARGAAPHHFFGHQGREGTWGERDPVSGPSGTADSRYGYGQRPRDPRQQRAMAHDRRQPAPDSVSYAERWKGFSSRFPDAAKIEVWRWRSLNDY